MTLQFLLTISTALLAIFFLLFYFRQQQHVKKLQSQIQFQTQDLTRANKATEQLREELNGLRTRLSHTLEDPITHLVSWTLFEDRLKQNIHESERYHLTLGIMFIDIDDFKMINDALGYEIGDKLLGEVAMRLRTCIRQVDSLTRFSKDTFVILLAQLNKPETAAIVAQRILQALKEPFIVGGDELDVTVGIGIAIFPTDGQDASTLLGSADHAMHLAKEKGTHLYQFYQADMHTRSQRELALHISLSRETLFDEFLLYYQPIINVQSDTIFCMETLLHWNHPQLGLINTSELLSYAEKQHKMNNIIEWLLASACRQFIKWRSLGFKPDYLALPLLVSQLRDSQFIYHISQILQNIGFNPGLLIFDIKESTMQVPFDVLQKAFNMLKYIGIKVAIDDFGADTFALRYLKNIHVNYLKLDPTLVADLESNEQTLALIKSILYLAHNLSIEIIVKGVESEEQVRILKELGCRLLQGHLIGSPLSEGEVTDKMIVPVSG